MLPISMINKQSGRDVLEHRLSSQLPHSLYGLLPPSLICSLEISYSLSPHQSRPQTHTEFRSETEGILCSYYCDVPI